MSTDRQIDAKGRITIPTEIREQLGLGPGERVRVEVEDGEIVVRPLVDRTDAPAILGGCINESTRHPEAEPLDPLTMKADWTTDLP